MNSISNALRELQRRVCAALDLDGSWHEREYLSASVDVYDLERRMRELDLRRSSPHDGWQLSAHI